MRTHYFVCLIMIGLMISGATADADSNAPDTRAVAVLNEPGIPVRGAASSPETIATILRRDHMQVRLVSARELANPDVFNAERFGVVIIPTGQSFPAEARSAFLDFLRHGGSFVSLGGYTFANLLVRQGGQWLPAKDVRAMNSATGVALNELKLEPDQIGIFDPSFPLKRVARIRTAPGQQVVRSSIDLPGAFRGWAASGIVGDYANNGPGFIRKEIRTNARWVPLLEAYDRYGRARGPAASMLLNFDGHYAGSNWAYFGVESADLFDKVEGSTAELLREVVRFLVRGSYLHGTECHRRLYKVGETVTAKTVVANRGRRPLTLRVEFAWGPAGAKQLAQGTVRTVTVRAGQELPVAVSLGSQPSNGDLWQVRTRLYAGQQAIDELTTGYVVERSEIVAAGAKLDFVNNYFRRSNRPEFLFGTDESAFVYLTPHENPLTWSRDLLLARDIGMNLYENLQYSNPDYQVNDWDWRNFRAMNQLTQKYNLVFMPGVLLLQDSAVNDAVLKAQAAQTASFAQRFADTPGLLLYLNGDIMTNFGRDQNQVKQLWNDWLRDRYHSTDVLRARWGTAAVRGELGSLTFPPPNSGRWDDLAAVDRHMFLAWIGERWHNAQTAAIRKHDEGRLSSSEFGAGHEATDARATMGGLSVLNFPYFGPIAGFPSCLHWFDLRLQGKGLGVGEYGSRLHPAWTGEGGPGRSYEATAAEEAQKELYSTVAHYALGAGASRIQNWCLRDAQARTVHAWGIVHPETGVPKDVAYVHRNLSMIWRHFTPKYAGPPAIAVCLPNTLRRGNNYKEGYEVGYRSFEGLLDLHYQFAVIDDDHLDSLPEGTRVLIYPAPFAVSDENFGRLLAWVKQGGTLLLSGDISYDTDRRQTRADRLQALCGVRLTGTRYENVRRETGTDVPVAFSGIAMNSCSLRPCVRVESAGANVLGKTDMGQPVLIRHSVGRGMVYYVTDPLELAKKGDPVLAHLRSLYSAVLTESGVRPLASTPNEKWLHVMEQATEQGAVHVVYNGKQDTSGEFIGMPTAAGEVVIRVRSRWPGLAAATKDGRLVAVNADGEAKVGGTPVMQGEGLKALLSLDGRDLRDSEALLVAPFEHGKLVLPARRERLVGVLGDFQGGIWKELDRLDSPAGTLSFSLDRDQATCLLLLCPANRIAEYSKHLNQAMQHPERIKGY